MMGTKPLVLPSDVAEEGCGALDESPSYEPVSSRDEPGTSSERASSEPFPVEKCLPLLSAMLSLRRGSTMWVAG